MSYEKTKDGHEADTVPSYDYHNSWQDGGPIVVAQVEQVPSIFPFCIFLRDVVGHEPHVIVFFEPDR